jgi:3-methylfumaryl-CoA hydratase
MDIDHINSWIGKTETSTEKICISKISALAATIENKNYIPSIKDALPPLWHWIFFVPAAPQSQIGLDGHVKRGGFLPPVPLPRRMWAGGKLEFHRQIMCGSNISRNSRIADITHKNGRQGDLIFVKVIHNISDENGVAISEEQSIVYKGETGRKNSLIHKVALSVNNMDWVHDVYPDPVFLFRYSALTFNGHRIHYDRPYATEIEGYPGLVVHGPLIATMLAGLVRVNLPNCIITNFEFRSISPLFDGAKFRLLGKLDERRMEVKLWACNEDGFVAMEAMARIIYT